MLINIPGIHLSGFAAFIVPVLAYWGALTIAYDVKGWFADRFEWDRPSWRPWTWRMYRRWFGPGQLVESDDYETALVLAVNFGPDGYPLDTWVQVQPCREDADLADPPLWLPLADLMPAAVGPFADDDTDSDVTPDDVVLTA